MVYFRLRYLRNSRSIYFNPTLYLILKQRKTNWVFGTHKNLLIKRWYYYSLNCFHGSLHPKDRLLRFVLISFILKCREKIGQQHYWLSVWLSKCAVKLYFKCKIELEAAKFYLAMVPVLTLSKSLKSRENVRFFRPEKFLHAP